MSVEIDADERTRGESSRSTSTDFDAAFAELDARYLAGEAAANAATWSVIAAEVSWPSTGARRPARRRTGSAVDHRRGERFAPGDLTAYPERAWELDEELTSMSSLCIG